MADAMSSTDKALAVPEFVHSTPDELRTAWRLIDVAAAQCSALKAGLLYSARQNPLLREHLNLLSEAIRQIDYQQRDAITFKAHYLGEIQP